MASTSIRSEQPRRLVAPFSSPRHTPPAPLSARAAARVDLARLPRASTSRTRASRRLAPHAMPPASRTGAPTDDDATLGARAASQVNAILERRADRRMTRATTSPAAAPARRAHGRFPARPPKPAAPAPAPGTRAAASAHNAEILARASAAADLATNAGKAAAALADARSRLGTNAPPGSLLVERGAARPYACGAAATANARQLDDRTTRRLREADDAAADAVAFVAEAAERNRNSRALEGDDVVDAALENDTLEEPHLEDEWEDVDEGDDDANAREFENVVFENGDALEKKASAPAARRTAAEREAARDVHKVHFLCLVARAAAMDAASSDASVRAAAMSALPRALALGEGDDDDEKDDVSDEKDEEGEGAFLSGASGVSAKVRRLARSLPTPGRVARLAKWFAGHVAIVPDDAEEGDEEERFLGGASRRKGPRLSRGKNSVSRGGRKRLRIDRTPLPALTRVKVVNDVIVLDERGDADSGTGGDSGLSESDEVVVVGETAAPSGAEGKAPPEKKAPAPSSSRHPPGHPPPAPPSSSPPGVALPARLKRALARMSGTQEEATALFVAAARAVGWRARTVVAFDPAPIRASDETKPEAAKPSEAPSEASVRHAQRPTRPGGQTSARSDRRATHWAEVLCRTTTRSTGGDAGRGGSGTRLGSSKRGANAEPTPRDVTNAARWVCVAPHALTGSSSRERWSFAAGAASVDDPGEIAASAKMGGANAKPPPYVVAFRGASEDAFSRAEGRGRGENAAAAFYSALRRTRTARDVTRKYAASYSKALARRAPASWVDAALEGGKGFFFKGAFSTRDATDPSASDPWSDPLVSAADAAEDEEMRSKERSERAPSTATEAKAHPTWVLERHLRGDEAIHPRAGVGGFVNGEPLFPRANVRRLRSAARWKMEARREVRLEEIGEPVAWAHSRASRERARAGAALRAREAAEAAKGPEGVPKASNASDGISRKPGSRRSGPVSLEARVASLKAAEASRTTKDTPGASSGISARGDVALYGEWQTAPWVPAPVPRGEGVPGANARGSVDLIGPASVPPPGTALISLPRAAKAARSLSPPCDFAPALVGFEYRRGGAATPRFEGIVVREEDEARVRAAWEKAEAERREAAERKARRDAARRWRVLMSAVWTRISLREEFGEDGDARAFEGGVGAKGGRREGGRGEGARGGGRAREDDRGVAGAAARIAEPSKRRRSEMIAGGSGKMAIVEGGAVADVEEM